MWNKIKPILVANNTSIDNLSPILLDNNDTLLPHLLSQLDSKEITKLLSELNIEVFVSSENIRHTQPPSFTLVNSQNNKIKAFSSNPFASISIFEIQNKARELNIIIDDQIGYIPENHPLFLHQKPKDQSENKQTVLDTVFTKAIANHVSDIHIMPRNAHYIGIHFRQFGEVVESNIHDIEINDYKIFANHLANISGNNGGSYRQSLEARFEYNRNNLNITVRLQRDPTVQQFDDSQPIPSFVLRIHNNDLKSGFKTIQQIGLLPEQQKILSALAQHNSGIIIVAGPTGAGKTTVLYAILAEATRLRKRIVYTIEDPVEISIPGIKQINIHKETGITYEHVINKSILRSDVDVVLVGEIRSADTAQGVFELDRLGHLVFSTVHAKRTTAIIDRLREFGVHNAHISDSLAIILSTRLVKKVCTHCAEQITAQQLYEFEQTDAETLTKQEKQQKIENHRLLKILRVTKKSKYIIDGLIEPTTKLALINPQGCDECVLGYLGRHLLAEVFVADDEMRALINTNTTSIDIENKITQHKEQTFWYNGINLVKKGVTTIEALELILPQYESRDFFTKLNHGENNEHN